MITSPMNHPIIPRENNVIIEKKQVTIHTEDRDRRIKGNGEPVETQSRFSIQLPYALENVAYVQLKNIQIPTYYINIAEKYKNNKISLQIGEEDEIVITIQDGLYSPELLMSQLYSATFSDYGGTDNTSFIDISSITVGKLLFTSTNANIVNGNDNIDITLRFKGFTYKEQTDCYYKNSVLSHSKNNNERWGLGYILGFDSQDDFTITYNSGKLISTKINDVDTDPLLISAPNDIRLNYLNTIYLEITDFNTISEVKPDIGNRNDTFNNGYHGLGDAALAKIPIPNNLDCIGQRYNLLAPIPSQFLETKKLFLNSFKSRVHKLDITFRDHTGSLIDFSNQDFTFTLEFGVLREVPNRILNILNFTQ
jgi:hypothetical protein